MQRSLHLVGPCSCMNHSSRLIHSCWQPWHVYPVWLVGSRVHADLAHMAGSVSIHSSWQVCSEDALPPLRPFLQLSTRQLTLLSAVLYFLSCKQSSSCHMGLAPETAGQPS